MRTPSNSRFVRARLVVLGVAAAVLAAVLVPTVAASAAPSAAPTPAPTHHVLAMGTFSAKDYAGQAAHLPGGLAAALKRDLHETPAQYLADSAAAVHAVKVIASLKSAGVHVLGSKISGTDLTVNVASTADKAAVTASGATAVVGAPTVPNLHKTTLHTDTATVTPAYGGEGYFFQTTAQLTTGYITLCSIGFNGYSTASGSAPQFVTAGHCATTISNSTSGGTGANLYTQTAPISNGGTRNTSSATFLGNTVAGEAKYAQDTNDDYGIVATGSSVVPQAALYTWGGGGGAPLSSAPLPVQGETAAVVGANLCKSGATTGWTCGSVIAVDDPTEVCPDGVSQCPDNYVNAILATTCALPGDSGSGAVIGNFAAGIDSGGNYGDSCANPYSASNPNGNFSAFFPMVSTTSTQTNSSIDAQVGSSWKLLAAPVVTSAATLAVNSALTGTLFNPLSGSTVSLYLDGSSTALATSSSSSGTWSVPLGSVAVGTHSYSLVETVGGNSVASVPGTFVVVAPGMLVKSASNPTIYVYDGSGTLIPVTSFSTVTDLGLSTAYYTVPDAVISGWTVASSALSNLISCSGTKYLGAQGKLWAVNSGEIGALPVESLSTLLCATLPVSSTPLASSVFIKGSAGTIYDFVGGQKEPVLAYSQMVALTAPNTPFWLTLNDGYLATIPTGPTLLTTGTLVKSASNPTIYVFDGSGGLIPVTSFGTVQDMGLSTAYSTVSDATITGVSQTALSNLVSCSGSTYIAAQGQLAVIPSSATGSLPVETLPATLCAVISTAGSALVAPVFVKGSGASIYQLTNGRLLSMTSYSQMQTLSGLSSPTWLTINDAYLNSVPFAPTVVNAGSLVKSASSPTIYLADGNGALIPVATFGTITDMGLSTAYSTVSASTISSLTISTTVLQNLVKCGSTTYLAAQGTLNPIASGAIGSLPIETLATSFCAVLPKTATALPSVVFIKGSAATIYYLNGGTKAPVATFAQMQSLSGQSSPTWLTINDVYIASIPNGTIPSS